MKDKEVTDITKLNIKYSVVLSSFRFYHCNYLSDSCEARNIAVALPLLNTRIHLNDGPLGVTLFIAR